MKRLCLARKNSYQKKYHSFFLLTGIKSDNRQVWFLFLFLLFFVLFCLFVCFLLDELEFYCSINLSYFIVGEWFGRFWKFSRSLSSSTKWTSTIFKIPPFKWRENLCDWTLATSLQVHLSAKTVKRFIGVRNTLTWFIEVVNAVYYIKIFWTFIWVNYPYKTIFTSFNSILK